MDSNTLIALVSSAAAIAAALYARDQHRVAVNAHALALKAQAHAETVHEENRRLIFEEKRSAVVLAAHSLLIRRREIALQVSAALVEVQRRKPQTAEDMANAKRLSWFADHNAEAMVATKKDMDGIENTPYSSKRVEQADRLGADFQRQLLEIESMEKTLPDLIAPPSPPPIDFTRV